VSAADERLAALEAQVLELQARMAALELPAVAPAPAPSIPTPDLGLLQQMQQRSGPPYEQGDTRGAVTYAGAVQFANLQYVWQIERPLPALLGLEPAPLARVLAALGSPARVTLVRTLLGGARNSQQLQAALGGVSTGQLYHHLKELRAAGIIDQHGRSDYRLAPSKIVPFLIVLAGAFDLLGNGPRDVAQEE
jgi:DNA-binding transcriptional ArsR family regulator